MTKTLKQKTINALLWSATEKFGQQTIFLIISIILARILEPTDYGLLGMITIFTAIARSFIDSGFNLALIRKQDANQSDYSTIFYFNISIAFILYTILFFIAPYIAQFYHEPRLTTLTRFMSLSLLINAFGMVQKTILTKTINFKVITKVTIFSVTLSGLIGIFMAFNGYSVWSLAVKAVTNNLFLTIFLWIFNSWRPSIEFNFSSFRSMYKFGSKLFLAGLLNNIFSNIYNMIIGKYYSAKELGYFSKGRQLQQMPVNNLMALIGGVSYPVLSTIQNDGPRLKKAYRQIIKLTIFLNFPLMIGLIVIAKPLFIVLLTEKWLPSVVYFQLLCFIGLLTPIAAINMNILNVKGRSDIFLKLDIVKKIIIIINVLITIKFGILALIIGMIISSIIGSFLNFYYSGKLIKYTVKEQLLDISPNLIVSIFSGIFAYFVGVLFGDLYLFRLIVQLIIFIIIYYLISRAMRFEAFYEAKNILFSKILRRSH